MSQSKALITVVGVIAIASLAHAAATASREAGAAIADADLTAPTSVAVVTVTAMDFEFQLPDTIHAGVTEFRLINRGPEPHHVWIVKLEEGRTLSDLYTALQEGGPPPAWITHIGGPNAPPPDGTSNAFIDIKPGRYAALCFIPSPDGTLHIMKGMAKEFIVAPQSSAPAALPRATTTMTLTDYDFTLTKPLASGRQVIRVVNTAAQPHEVFIGRLLPGRTVADMLEWEKNPGGPPPLVPIGGTTGIAHGAENTIVVDLEPGEYGLYCFVPDAGDGKPHVAHGMFRQIRVK